MKNALLSSGSPVLLATQLLTPLVLLKTPCEVPTWWVEVLEGSMTRSVTEAKGSPVLVGVQLTPASVL